MPGYIRPMTVMALLIISFIGPLGGGKADCEENRFFHCPLAFRNTETSPLAEVIFQKAESGEEIHFTLKIHNLANITMVHLHLGLKEVISTPVVWIYPPVPPPKLIPGPFKGILAQGTITAKDLVGPLRDRPLSALIKEMDEGNTYVNIHTKEHPEGVICGLVESSVQ